VGKRVSFPPELIAFLLLPPVWLYAVLEKKLARRIRSNRFFPLLPPCAPLFLLFRHPFIFLPGEFVHDASTWKPHLSSPFLSQFLPRVSPRRSCVASGLHSPPYCPETLLPPLFFSLPPGFSDLGEGTPAPRPRWFPCRDAISFPLWSASRIFSIPAFSSFSYTSKRRKPNFLEEKAICGPFTLSVSVTSSIPLPVSPLLFPSLLRHAGWASYPK